MGCYILLSECAPADDCLRGAAAGGRSATSNIVDQKWKKNILKTRLKVFNPNPHGLNIFLTNL